MTGRKQSAWKHLTEDLSFLRRIHQHRPRPDDCCNSRSVQRTASLKHKTGRQFHWRWQTFKTFLLNYNSFFKDRISRITGDFILTFVSNLLFKYTTSFVSHHKFCFKPLSRRLYDLDVIKHDTWNLWLQLFVWTTDVNRWVHASLM